MYQKASNFKIFSIVFFVFSFFMFILEPVEAKTNTVKLVFAHSNSGMHNQHAKVFVPWAKQIKELSDGEVEIELRPESMNDAQVLSLLKLGAIDIAWNVRTFNPDDLPLSSVFELPFMVKNGEQGSVAFWKAIENFQPLANEYAGIKLLAVSVSTPSGFSSNKKAIRSLNDLKGLSVFFPNGMGGKAMEIFGVAMPKADNNIQVNTFAQNMSLGFFDTIALPAEALPVFKLDSIIKYHTDVAFSSYTFWMAMNLKKYKALPAKVKKLIDDTTGQDLSRKMGMVSDQSTAAVLVSLKEKYGVENIVLPEGEMQEMRKMVQKTSQESWSKTMDAKGMQGKQTIGFVKHVLANL